MGPQPGKGLAKGLGESGDGFEPFDDFGLGLNAEGFVFEFAVFEEEEGGDVADAVFDGEVGLFVDIDLDDSDGGAFFVSDFVEDGAEHFAGAAPFGPEVDDDGDGGLEDVGGKGGLGGEDDCCAGHRDGMGLGDGDTLGGCGPMQQKSPIGCGSQSGG